MCVAGRLDVDVGPAPLMAEATLALSFFLLSFSNLDAYSSFGIVPWLGLSNGHAIWYFLLLLL